MMSNKASLGMMAASNIIPGLTIVNPATNDSPLEFNMMTPVRPMSVLGVVEDMPSLQQLSSASKHDTMSRNVRDRQFARGEVGKEKQRHRLWERRESEVIPAQPTVEALPNWRLIYPMMPIDAESSMMGMVPLPFNQFGPLSPDPGLTPLSSLMPLPLPSTPHKDIIQCQSCVLLPPNPASPPPTTRERPPGCRTVFVGGLPESITEEIIREIFDRCGYRIRLGIGPDSPNSGRLHVDYAQARDDFYDWECMNRQLQREMRHRERVEQERQRQPSPPPVVQYSDHEASLLAEKLKSDDCFQKAVQVLATWLERGDCSKRNAVQFYSMIQSTNSHVRRLMNEKTQYEEELLKAKEQLSQRMRGIFLQFNQIEKVFVAANHQKVWDHFTKPQRKNIDMWKKQAQEIKNSHVEDALNERQEDEMEFSEEDEAPPEKRTRSDDSNASYAGGLNHQLNCLKEENDSLRCQLEAYKNEVDLIKAENKQELEEKTREIRSLQESLKENQKDDRQNAAVYTDLHCSAGMESSSDITSTTSTVRISERDAQLIGLISTFLHVHPFGAGVDYIWSYLFQMNNSLKPRDVECLLLKFPTLFREAYTGVGASLERKWTFSGFSACN